jgi:hypothetical protein
MLITAMPATAIRTSAVVLSGLLLVLPVAGLLGVEPVFVLVGKATPGVESEGSLPALVGSEASV